jgi:hypothetical protein
MKHAVILLETLAIACVAWHKMLEPIPFCARVLRLPWPYCSVPKANNMVVKRVTEKLNNFSVTKKVKLSQKNIGKSWKQQKYTEHEQCI